ncbi:hypothetical protein AAFM46_06920 [Arthrobacter sp. TMP15]|uniref:hypothetical protein n=1 Tax=Arthrobacter sp. TMP15 TaxID=3140789 RepID=UPI0031BB4036
MSWLKNSVSVAIPLPGAPEGTRMGRQDPTWTLDKSPLPLTEVKPLAVGHWGTTPGQNFISVHLNGYNISNPTVLARIEPPEVDALLPGCGNDPRYVEGEDPAAPHQLMAAVLEEAIEDILSVNSAARVDGCTRWPRWPVLVLRSPKEWTGPKTVDGLPVEGTFRSHQVPLLVEDAHPEHGERLEQWLRTYRPEELFDECAKLKIRALPW